MDREQTVVQFRKEVVTMKRMGCIAFYIFISFLACGIGAPVLAGPMRPIVEENEEKRISTGEAKEELQQLQKEVQKNIEKTEQIRLEQKQQETMLKNTKDKLRQIEERLPS
jgi:septal ring factor EnvC (AmiA/AmiB activator)